MQPETATPSAIEQVRDFLQAPDKIRDGRSFLYIYVPHALRMIEEYDALAAELAALREHADKP